MPVDAAEPLFGQNLEPYDFWHEPVEKTELAAAFAHQLAEAVMTVAGLLFWAVLAAGYLTAALSPD